MKMNKLNNLKSGEFLVDGEVLQFDDFEFVELKVSTSQKLADIENVLGNYNYSVDHKSCGIVYSVVVWLNWCEYAVWSINAGSGIENEVNLETLKDILAYQSCDGVGNG